MATTPRSRAVRDSDTVNRQQSCAGAEDRAATGIRCQTLRKRQFLNRHHRIIGGRDFKHPLGIIAADSQRASAGAPDHNIFGDRLRCRRQDDGVAIEDRVKGNRALGITTAAKTSVCVIGNNRFS